MQKKNSSCFALVLCGAAVRQEGELAVRLLRQVAASLCRGVRGSELGHRVIRQVVFMSRQPAAVWHFSCTLFCLERSLSQQTQHYSWNFCSPCSSEQLINYFEKQNSQTSFHYFANTSKSFLESYLCSYTCQKLILKKKSLKAHFKLPFSIFSVIYNDINSCSDYINHLIMWQIFCTTVLYLTVLKI